MKHQDSSKYNRAKQNFKSVNSKHRLTVYYDMTSFPPTRTAIDTCIQRCARGGVQCIIPRLPEGLTPSLELLDQIAAVYRQFIEAAKLGGLHIGFLLDPVMEQSVYLSTPKEIARETRTRVLYRREYYCDPHEELHVPLHGGTLMSLVAYDDEHADMIDLREYIKDGVLHYTVPDGNWTIEEYICTPDPIRDIPPLPMCNRMSADHCLQFLDDLFHILGEDIRDELGQTINYFLVQDICFHAANRRNWDEHFNEVFEQRYGFDPSPYYPALNHAIGQRSSHMKSVFMDCRAAMLRSGVFAALKAFTDRHNVRLLASVSQPKLPACSWLNGDTLANGLFSPFAVQEMGYLYGLNSTHLAASAADNYGSKYICCELFRDYGKYNPDIACKDAMNAFGHGANMLLAHFTDTNLSRHLSLHDRRHHRFLGPGVKPTFSPFVSRVQSLLRGGSRINDIAMLYPIYALHDKVFLYQAPSTSDEFEYPNTPFTCNYMTVLDTLSTYAGQDITIIHPEVVNSSCYTENGRLYLRNAFQTQQFRILILPSADMVSLQNLRLIRDFYDAGGKIIATGLLPTYAFEYSVHDEKEDPNDFMGLEPYGTANDKEVRAIIRHIFGDETLDESIIRDFYHQQNENGGESYYIGSNQTAADGTSHVDCACLNDALQSLGIPLDVYMPEMPRFECFGGFNNSYNEFVRLGLRDYIPGGGMMSHMHKQRNGLDIYFFANSTDRSYDHYIYLRGIHAPELWDPHTGRIRRMTSHYVRFNGEIYTRVTLYLYQDRAVFLIDRPNETRIHNVMAQVSELPDVTSELNMMQHSPISQPFEKQNYMFM